MIFNSKELKIIENFMNRYTKSPYKNSSEFPFNLSGEHVEELYKTFGDQVEPLMISNHSKYIFERTKKYFHVPNRGYVYVFYLKGGYSFPYKIGRTQNLKQRINAHKYKWGKENVEIITTIFCENHKLVEEMFLSKFIEKREVNEQGRLEEWFELEPEDVEWILKENYFPSLKKAINEPVNKHTATPHDYDVLDEVIDLIDIHFMHSERNINLFNKLNKGETKKIEKFEMLLASSVSSIEDKFYSFPVSLTQTDLSYLCKQFGDLIIDLALNINAQKEIKKILRTELDEEKNGEASDEEKFFFEEMLDYFI